MNKIKIYLLPDVRIIINHDYNEGFPALIDHLKALEFSDDLVNSFVLELIYKIEKRTNELDNHLSEDCEMIYKIDFENPALCDYLYSGTKKNDKFGIITVDELGGGVIEEKYINTDIIQDTLLF